ncbi:MAG: Asp-tRNA(Asn)/Glu-tRNA(Gln) amidotransferase subunit GatC [Minisyncoccia bacterium]
MLEIKDIEKLATLARIKLTDEEKVTFLKEIDPILGYVAQLKEVSEKISNTKKVGEHRNIIRSDENMAESGFYTEVVVAEMPESEGNYLKVKKIL